MIRPRTTWRRALAVAALATAVVTGAALVTAQGGGAPTDPQLRLKAWDSFVKMRAASPFQGAKWQFLGPTNIGGRATDVAVVTPKGKSYTIYVAEATGGVWRTLNEGVTWEPIFDQAPSTAIGDVTVAPSNPDIIWIGTGEANIFRSSNAGVGVYKSVDAGKSWQHVGLEGSYTIARIVIHPRNPNIVYVASSGHEWSDNPERGVFKTIDGGKTWSRVLYVDEKTGANDLVMDPVDPNVLYATTWQRIRKRWNDPRNEPGYRGSGVYKSVNGGRTWTPINAGLPDAAVRGRIGIDVCRSKPNVLYAFVDNYEIARQAKPGELDAYGRQQQGTIKGAEIYRSDDKGRAWRKVSESGPYMERAAGTYGWVFGQVRVDPNDAETVYFLGLDLNQSTDGGRTFKPLDGMHGDHHALWIDPANSNYLFNGHDGGVSVSYDKGRAWRNFTDNLPAVQFFNVSYDLSTPFNVYGSIQDHGSRRAAVDLSRGRDKVPAVAFQNAPGGEGSTHAIDPNDPNTVYSSTFYGRLTRTNMAGVGPRGRFQSVNVVPKAGAGEPPLRGQWLAPTFLSPHNSNIVYHGMQYLFRSVNRGDTWERISADLSRNDPKELGDIPYQTVFSASESPKRFGLIYAGTDDGRLHVTRDAGRTWTEITRGLAADRWISRVVASGFDEGTVYAAQNGKRWDDFAAYVWKSTDFGATWKSIAANIPCGPVNVILESPVDPKVLYVGTDMGVFVSTNGGSSWEVLGGNLPSTFVHDIVVHPRDRMIVIATHGRGLWVMDDSVVTGKR